LSHFKLLKRLGCGDIGSVYLAELRGSRSHFAMKVMLSLCVPILEVCDSVHPLHHHMLTKSTFATFKSIQALSSV